MFPSIYIAHLPGAPEGSDHVFDIHKQKNCHDPANPALSSCEFLPVFAQRAEDRLGPMDEGHHFLPVEGTV